MSTQFPLSRLWKPLLQLAIVGLSKAFDAEFGHAVKLAAWGSSSCRCNCTAKRLSRHDERQEERKNVGDDNEQERVVATLEYAGISARRLRNSDSERPGVI